MKNLTMLTIALFALAAFGCQTPTEPSDNLNVGFEWSTNGLKVEFTDTTNPPGRSWSWSFGDATGKSIEQHPLYEYLAEGEYTVKFTSCSKSNMTGNCSTATRLITVP